MARRFVVGDRVDGLYDGNSDDAWYPGFITAVHGDGDAFDVLYDDGEAEQSVATEFLRVHLLGTICAGSRVYGRYAGGDEWYAGKILEAQDDGTFTIEYDDGEVEPSVPMEFIRETLLVAAEEDPADANPEEDQEPVVGETPPAVESAEVERPATPVSDTAVVQADAKEEQPVVEETSETIVGTATTASPVVAAAPDDEPSDVSVQAKATPEASQSEELIQQTPKERRRSRTKSQPPSEEGPSAVADAVSTNGVVDEYANILSTMERLENCAGDATATKTLLSTLVKQMRAFPQATADLVHSRGGEGLLMDILKQHHTHAVIQCYGFVLLRRLCFLCGKSTHFFLRNGIVDLVTIAMRKFPEDAILQASACGALAVFTRVHAGLAALLENRVSHLVLATIIFHKSYSVHTRQVHYYACEVLLELCELGDKTTIEALCGDSISGPGLSDLSPVSLLLFLLRQALSFEDKKACCAAGTLLMCLASCHRHAAQMVLDLNGLSELSTVMAKFPMEPGIQKYAASASKEIAICSMDQSSPHRRVQHAAHNVLGESNSMEDLHSQQHYQQRRAGGKTAGNAKSSGGKRKGPTSQRSGVSSMNGFPTPAHQQQVGAVAANARDALSFSKYTSPIGKAPHLPPNIRPFGDTNAAPSPSAAAYHHQLQQQRNQTGSPLVILDSHGAMASDKKRFVKGERTNLLFETYGVDAKSAMNPASSHDHHMRTQGIKRRQLKTHIVSASTTGGANDGISWASPVKSVILHDAKPLSSRSDKHTAKVSAGESRKVRSSGGEIGGGMDVDEELQSPATLRRQQQQAATKVSKKKEGDVKTPRSASFQLKLENAQVAASSSGLASPIVLSPKTNRQGVNSSRSKITTKSSSNRSATRAKATSRDSGMGSNASTESLNSYAAHLFKDEIEASARTSTEAAGAREAAQERERLSFAEKLHKMIDKAKSSLAHTSTVSLNSEVQSSPVKPSKRPEPVQSASVKKKMPPSVSVTKSRVAPASLKSAGAVGDIGASASTSDVPLAKKPPVAIPKAAPVKKVIAPVPSTHAIASKSIAPPKSKLSGVTPARPAPPPSSTSMKTTAPAISNRPANKPASTTKAAASAKTSKISEAEDVAVAAAAVTAITVGAYELADENELPMVSAESASPQDDSSSSQKLDEDTNSQTTPIVEGAVAESLKTTEVVAGSALEEPAQLTAPSESVVAEDSVSDSVIAEPPKASEETVAVEQTSAELTDVPPSETKTVEAVVEEAAAVASSVADDMYADEYNDFDDLDNGPQTMDDDGVDAGTDMGNGVSFEALMSMTAQVTEFSVATETVIEAEIPPVESAEAPTLAVDEPDRVTLAEGSAPEAPGSSDAAVEAEPDLAPASDEQADNLAQIATDTLVDTSMDDAPKLEVDVDSSEPAVDAQGHSDDVASDQNPQAGDATETDTKDPEALLVEESGVALERSEEKPEHRDQDAVEDQKTLAAQADEVTVETDEREVDQGASILSEADRPESCQTDVSYADEDFDDAPEDVEGNAAVEVPQEAEEATLDAIPPTTVAFTVAEPLAELENDAHVAQESGSVDDHDAQLPTKPETSVGDPSADENKTEAQTEVSQDNEEDYADAEFAGDESVPVDELQLELHESVPVKEAAAATDDSSARDPDADGTPFDALTAEGTKDAAQENAEIKETSVTVDPTETEEVPGDTSGEPTFESNEVSTEATVLDSETETVGSLMTIPADDIDANSGQSDDVANKEDVVSPGELVYSDTDKSLLPELKGERTMTPDIYDDADFDGDAAESFDAVNSAEMANDVNIDTSGVPVTSEDQEEQEPTINPVYEPDSQQEMTSEEAVTRELDRQATPDAYAEDLQYDEEQVASSSVGAEDASPDQMEVELPPVIEAERVLDGNATDGDVPAAAKQEPAAVEGAAGLVDSETNFAANVESTPTVSDETEEEVRREASSIDAESTTQDQILSASDGAAAVGDTEQAPVSVSEAELSTHPAEPTREDRALDNDESVDEAAVAADKDDEENTAAGQHSPPVSEDSPEVAVAVHGSTDATLPDGDLALPSSREGVDSAGEEHEDAPPADEESRPATAAGYDDDGFDGETPRTDQIPPAEISVNDETNCEAGSPDRETNAANEDANKEAAEPVTAHEESSYQVPAQDDVARPTTADAYGSDTEFEDDTTPGDHERRPEVTSPMLTSDEAAGDETAVQSAEVQGEQHEEQGSDAVIEARPDDEDELLMKDTNDMLDVPTDVPVTTDADVITMDNAVAQETDQVTVPSEEAEPSPSNLPPTAFEAEESSPIESRSISPSEGTAFDDYDADETSGHSGTAGPSETPDTPEAKEKDVVEEENVSAQDAADGEMTAVATDDVDASENVPLDPSAAEADTREANAMLDGEPPEKVEDGKTEETPISTPGDGDELTTLEHVNSEQLANTAIVADTSETQEGCTDNLAQDAIGSARGCPADAEQQSVEEVSPDTLAHASPADEQPAVKRSTDHTDDIIEQPDMLIPNDDLPEDNASKTPETSLPTEAELSPENSNVSDESDDAGAPVVEPAEESELHQFPGEPIEGATENETSQTPHAEEVGEAKLEPEEPPVGTARTDPDGAYGDDDFDDPAAEVSAQITENEPLDKPETFDSPISDAISLSEDEAARPSNDTSEVTAPIVNAETNALAIENEDSSFEGQYVEEEPSAPSLLEPPVVCVQAEDLVADQGSLAKQPDADVDDQGAAKVEPESAAVEPEVSVDSAEITDEAMLGAPVTETAVGDESETDGGTLALEDHSSELPSPSHEEEEAPSITLTPSTPLETDPAHEIVDSSTSEIGPHMEEAAQADTIALEQESNSTTGALLTAEDGKENESVDEQTSASESEPLAEAVPENEPAEVSTVNDEDTEAREPEGATVDDLTVVPMELAQSGESQEELTPTKASEPMVAAVLADEHMEADKSLEDNEGNSPPEAAAPPRDDTVSLSNDGVATDVEPDEPTPSAVDTSDVPLPSETHVEVAPEATVSDSATGDNSELPQDYAYDDEETTAPEDQIAAVHEAAVTPTQAAVEDDEPLYKDDDNEFEEDSPRTAAPAPPSIEADAAASTRVETAPSPSIEDAEYDDFEADDPATPRPEAAPAVAPKLDKQPTKDEIDDETAYADDDDAYNDFEDDEAPPPKKAPVLAPDDTEDAYDMEETFDEDDKPAPRIPPAASAATAAPVPASGAASGATPAEEDGDYDAEYDEFED